MTIFCTNCDKKVMDEDIFQDEFCSEECFRESLMDIPNDIREILREQRTMLSLNNQKVN